MRAKVKGRCPLNTTKLFDKNFPEMFYMPAKNGFDQIKQRFLRNQAHHISGERYRVYINGMPLIVVMDDNATLVTINSAH